MIRLRLAAWTAVALGSGLTTAAPHAFDVTIEVSNASGTTTSSAVVVAGAEASVSMANPGGEVLREVHFRVAEVNENSAELKLKVVDASSDTRSESLMELEYGKTGSLLQSGRDPMNVKATIRKIEAGSAASDAER